MWRAAEHDDDAPYVLELWGPRGSETEHMSEVIDVQDGDLVLSVHRGFVECAHEIRLKRASRGGQGGEE